MSVSEAYEKMLQDGSAFKKVDMTMDTELNLSEAQGMGEKVNSPHPRQRQPEQIQIQERHDDYTQYDSDMQQKINSLRAKMNGHKQHVSENRNLEIAKLKKRIDKIEEALMLIMETHESLLG